MMPFVKPVFQFLQESLFAVQVKRDFRYQHEVHLLDCQCGVGCYEARVAAHKFYQGYAVVSVVGFVVCVTDDVMGYGESRLEPERFLNKVDVVVYSFRNAGHCDLEVSFGDFLIDGVCAPESAVAADAEQHVYVEDLDCVNHFAHILVTAGSAEKCSA